MPDWRKVPLPVLIEVHQLHAGYGPELTLEWAPATQSRDDRLEACLVQRAYQFEQLLLGAPNPELVDGIKDRVAHGRSSPRDQTRTTPVLPNLEDALPFPS